MRKTRQINDVWYVCAFSDDDEISEACSNDSTIEDVSNSERITSKPPTSHVTHSRLTPEMRRLRTRRLSLNVHAGAHNTADSESDTSSAATTPSTTPGTTPRSRATPSPRSSGVPVNFIESPRPHSGGSVVPAFIVNSRKPRTSPRTTCSLDNVDLWEESDSEVDLSHMTDGDDDADPDSTLVNPSETADVPELRRSQSPVACKRNKVSDEGGSAEETAGHVTCKQTDRRDHVYKSSLKKSKARTNRRFKHMFANARTPMTIQEAHESGGDQTQSDRARAAPLSAQPQAHKLLSGRHGNRLATKFTKVKSKSELFSTTTNLSMLSESLSIEPSPRVQRPSSTTKGCCSKNNVATTAATVFESENTASRQLRIAQAATDSVRNSTLNVASKPQKETLTAEGSPNARKVKFNSFVTVRDDENSTLDFLKNSTDTAKMFKNKYLRPDPSGKEDVSPFLQTIH